MEDNTNQPSAAPAPQGGRGPMIGAAIILGLIVVGGVYFYGLQLQQKQAPEELPLILGNEPVPVPAADDVSAIEADVNAADMQDLETQIEADLDALDKAL